MEMHRLVFRSKDEKGKWVKGMLCISANGFGLLSNDKVTAVKMLPLQQCIYHSDEVEYFEGDILDIEGDKYVISWNNDCARFDLVNAINSNEVRSFNWLFGRKVKIVGNIVDNFEDYL